MTKQNTTLSFVIPVFNEERRITKTFQALSELQLAAGVKLQEIIFVNDGSTDETAEMVERFANTAPRKMKITLLTYSQNMGKGFAIRQGMLHSTSNYTLFFDADMSTPLTEIKKFIPFIKKNKDIIIGTRKNGHSTVIKHQPIIRELLGRGFTKLTQIMLAVNVTDFTCGFKAFSRIAKDIIFNTSTVDHWGYDAEVMFLAQRNGFSITEIPVIWSNDERTKVNIFKAIPQTLLELFSIRMKYHLASYPFFTAVKPLTNN